MLIVNENMKAKVGDQNWDHERAMGNHGLGEINGNGERLCETCNMNELVITGRYLIICHPRASTKQRGFLWTGRPQSR